MAQSNRRGQNPRPRKEDRQWKIRYWADIVNAAGQHQRVRRTACLGLVETTTFSEACQKARRLLTPINDLAEGIEYRGRTMQELIDRYRQAVLPHLKPTSRNSYEWGFGYVAQTWGRRPVAAIGRSEVQDFLTSASRDLSPSSVRSLLTYTRMLFSAAQDWGWITASPAAGRKHLPEPLPVRPRRILPPEVFWRLVGALPPPESTLVQIGALAGLRCGEMAALRWNDNSEPGILVVDENFTRGHLGTPKSARSRRRQPIGAACQAALDQWRHQARWTEPEDSVFRRVAPRGQPVSLDAPLKRIRATCRVLGIEPICWHDLRRTYATWGRVAGVAPETMRDLLGHSRVDMTFWYSQLRDGAAAARIEEYATRRVM